jgi:large subunit ribosomal protein L13
MKTYSPKPRDIERRWYVIDASDAVLGRLASEVAAILRGKHKPIFAPHADTGDHVIVINARGVRLTGGKEAKKFAYRHSGYPGGLTATQYSRLLSDKPEFAVEKAIKGMLPKNRLGRAMGKKLQVYAGANHPHSAQKPEPLILGEVPPWSGLPALKTRHVQAPKEEPEVSSPAPKRRAAKPAASESAPAKTAAKRTTAKRTSAKPASTKTTAAKAGTAKRPGRRTKKED